MDESVNQAQAERTPASPASAFFIKHAERGAYCILLMWCMLPVAAGIVFVIQGALGKYLTKEEILSRGMEFGHINNTIALKAYQTMFFVLGAVTLLYMLLCLALSHRRFFSLSSAKEQPWFYLLAAMLAWAVLSSAASDYLYNAVTGTGYFRDGLASFFVYGSVFLCATIVQRESWCRHILWTFAGVISLMALLMIVQEKTHPAFLDYVFSASRAAVFNQFNHFGYMLSMAFADMIGLLLFDRPCGKGQRVLYVALAMILAYALAVNDTFGAILAAALSVPVMLLLYVCSGRRINKRAAALVLALVVLAGICFFAFVPAGGRLLNNFTELGRDLVKIAARAEDAGSAGTGRLELWRDTLQRISERPVFGYGPEGFIGKNAITDEKRPHNEYLAVAGYLGIPALVLYLAALITLIVRQWRRLKRLKPTTLVAAGMTAAYLMSAFVGNSVFNTAPYFWLFLGLTAAVCEGETPLLCPTEESAEHGGKGTGLVILLGLALCVLLGIAAGLSLKKERDLELEDLRTMRDAETAAREAIDPAALGEETEYYWYDKQGGIIYPAYLARTAPCGMGSANSGGGLLAFYKQNGFAYRYDESADYTGKTILVAVAPNGDGDMKVGVVWYGPDN